MISPKNLEKYFGFTEKEIREQCTQYDIDYTEIEKWYDNISNDEKTAARKQLPDALI